MAAGLLLLIALFGGMTLAGGTGGLVAGTGQHQLRLYHTPGLGRRRLRQDRMGARVVPVNETISQLVSYLHRNDCGVLIKIIDHQ